MSQGLGDGLHPCPRTGALVHPPPDNPAQWVRDHARGLRGHKYAACLAQWVRDYVRGLRGHKYAACLAQWVHEGT